MYVLYLLWKGPTTPWLVSLYTTLYSIFGVMQGNSLKWPATTSHRHLSNMGLYITFLEMLTLAWLQFSNGNSANKLSYDRSSSREGPITIHLFAVPSLWSVRFVERNNRNRTGVELPGPSLVVRVWRHAPTWIFIQQSTEVFLLGRFSWASFPGVLFFIYSIRK